MSRSFRCPMCGGGIQLAAGRCLNCGEKFLPTDAELAEVRREFKRWVIRRSAIAGVATFVVLLAVRFGSMLTFSSAGRSAGWSDRSILDFLFVCAIALVGAAATAVVTGARVWWFWHEINAVRSGMTPAFYLGQLLRRTIGKPQKP